MTEAAGPPDDAPTRTGVTQVDDVLRDLEATADRPPEEQVAVFESAHTRLRQALDDPSD